MQLFDTAESSPSPLLQYIISLIQEVKHHPLRLAWSHNTVPLTNLLFLLLEAGCLKATCVFWTERRQQSCTFRALFLSVTKLQQNLWICLIKSRVSVQEQQTVTETNICRSAISNRALFQFYSQYVNKEVFADRSLPQVCSKIRSLFRMFSRSKTDSLVARKKTEKTFSLLRNCLPQILCSKPEFNFPGNLHTKLLKPGIPHHVVLLNSMETETPLTTSIRRNNRSTSQVWVLLC